MSEGKYLKPAVLPFGWHMTGAGIPIVPPTSQLARLFCPVGTVESVQADVPFRPLFLWLWGRAGAMLENFQIGLDDQLVQPVPFFVFHPPNVYPTVQTFAESLVGEAWPILSGRGQPLTSVQPGVLVTLKVAGDWTGGALIGTVYAKRLG